MMKNKNKHSLALCITLHQPHFSATGKNIPDTWNSTLFPAMTDTYIPLLQMFDRITAENIPFRINLLITPTLCSLLDDYIVQEQYTQWLENLITLGENELVRTKDDTPLYNLVESYLENLTQIHSYFVGTCQGSILPKFAEYAKSGNIELMATTVEQCYLPHYINLNEVVDAQIEAGMISHRNFFGLVPDGFWLPSMGYADGLAVNIHKYGFNYTILDTHGFLFANPPPQAGIFSPLRCKNTLAVFARDYSSWTELFGAKGFMHNSAYRNQNRDIGFELPEADLHLLLKKDQARYATGFKYWAQKKAAILYNINAAQKQIELDATTFVDEKLAKLTAASNVLDGKSVSLVCTFDGQDLGQNWHEGINWLYQVFRKIAQQDDIACELCSELLEDRFNLQKTEFFMSAVEGSGYGENLLDNKNSWMFRYGRKSIERMVDLAERFPDDNGLKERALNLAARQILFSSSSDWPKMVHDGVNAEQAENLFTQSILDFSTIFDSLGANCINTEWLLQTEKKYPFFAWVNYRIFCKKVSR